MHDVLAPCVASLICICRQQHGKLMCIRWLSTGLLDRKGAQEWVVTTKLGSSDKRPGTATAPRDCRFYAGEMLFSTFVLTAAFYGIFSVDKWSFSIFLTLQGVCLHTRCCGVSDACMHAC